MLNRINVGSLQFIFQNVLHIWHKQCAYVCL